MNETVKKNTPEELYRAYQAGRDNISPVVLTNLREAAEQKRHEEGIHAILEQAKTAPGRSSNTAVNTDTHQPINNIVERFKEWFSPAWGGAAVAAALIAMVAVPMFNSTGLNPAGHLSHLAGCDECAQHARNASPLTRSTSIGQARVAPEAITAAKLGRISAKLKIAQAAGLSTLETSARNELQKLATRTENSELTALAEANDMGKTLAGIELYTQGQGKVFAASEALFVANVSARDTSSTDVSAAATDSFKYAQSSFAAIEAPSQLQLNLQGQLATAIEQDLNSPEALQKVIDLTRRAMESLGG